MPSSFPLGPVRLADSFVTLPGQDTIDYKTSTFESLAPGFDLAAGVGNRDSDITAYTNAGFAAELRRPAHAVHLDVLTPPLAAAIRAARAFDFADIRSVVSPFDRPRSQSSARSRVCRV